LSKDSVTLTPGAHEDVTLSVTAASDCEISSKKKVKVTGTSQNALAIDCVAVDAIFFVFFEISKTIALIL